MRTVVVIGGGMSGTAAAHMVMRRGYDVTILEQNDRIGGRIYSKPVGGVMSEMGAGFMTGEYTSVLPFLKEAGLDDKLLERNSGASIVRDGVPQDLTKLKTLLGTSWLSWGAKRLLLTEFLKVLPVWKQLDLHKFWKAHRFDTESLADHFKGKYGQEMLDYVIGPALDAYLYWTPDHTSYAVGKALFKGASALRQRHTYILRDGLSQIPEAAAQGASVLLSHKVKQIYQAPSGKYAISVQTPTGDDLRTADGIVCATTASVVPRIVKGLTPAQHDFFAAIQYSSTVNVTYRLPRTGKDRTLAVGYPRTEHTPLNAMTVLSDVDPESVIVKLYASGSVSSELRKKTDKEVEAILSAGVQVDLDPARKSGEWHVHRWDEALPYFDVGSIKRMQSFVNGEIEDESPLVFAGDYLGGPFIDGAFASGVRAASRLEQKLIDHPPED